MILRPVSWFILLGSILLAACAPSVTVNRGTLEGHVTFSPPPNSNQPAATAAPLFYEQHSLIIYRSDGSTLVTNVLLDAQANFSVALDPGDYLVKWRKHEGEATTDLPKKVTVESGKVTRLEVNIITANP